MENKDKFKMAFTLACFGAIYIFFSTQNRKHRKQKQSQNCCYLKTETKPQNTFKRVLADNSYSQFKHLKLNTDSTTTNEYFSNSHPFKTEISSLLKNPDIDFEFFYGNMDLQMSDSYVWVETESQLKELLDVLSKERVFGVDTEQHSLRSFLGFTALIQISTRSEDYLVDTIALHDVMRILCPVFANPSICKVFHGADNDVLWLQRDFHVYVVNLFDTAKACDVLSKPQKSLAYLLETYCGVATNKLLQREDWRQRPLPVEMVQYARTDAHYLLFIAHCLASELLQQGNRKSAGSSIISRHMKDRGSDSLIFSDTKDFVRRICAWRDLMARLHDESLRYILSDHAIVALADEVPTTEADIYTTISRADLNAEFLNFNSSLQSPSPIICSHWEDFNYLFEDNISMPNDIFQLILQKHLGPTGSCPLSIYNYSLLSESNLKLTQRLISKQNGFKNAKQVAQKASRDLFVQKFSCKSPVYDNCRIYANDGRLLCYCDRRKLEWYLRRDLAKLVDEDPPAIILLFEPKGRPEDEGNDFYIQSKKNICVACGEGNHYLRYRIIPSCYRMHFPEHLKSHRSHDIVLLCVDCHEIAHTAAEKHKKVLAAEFGIPLYVRKVVYSSQAQDTSQAHASVVNLEEAGVSPLQLQTAAMALLRHGPTMPSKRREELTQIVMKYYGGREISEEDLERALLVGMSPHERRRLEKKRGLSFKHSTGSIIPDNEPENNSSRWATSATGNASDIDGVNSLHTTERETCNKEGGVLLMITNMDARSPSICFDTEANGDASAVDSKDVNLDGSEVSVSDGTVSSVHSSSDANVSRKRDSKLSLLGHGPHGKQVVEHLLKEYGEDGIRQFCQRWRQVFVEATHPRFLPAGWDIMHSGRRAFGKYSVYNPAKVATVAED